MADVEYLKTRRQTLRDNIRETKESLSRSRTSLAEFTKYVKEDKQALRAAKEELNSINKQIKQLKNVTAEAA